MKEENDLFLTKYFRKIKKRMDPLNIAIRDGKLRQAALIAEQMHEEQEKFLIRLHRITPMPPLPDGYK
jgi:hypothetical protein